MQHDAALKADAALARAVGFGGLTASVINVIVGSGIFMLPAALYLGMGNAAPLAFVVGAMLMIPIALCFAAAGSRVVATGGPYTYVGEAFGPFAGFVAGALMWITNVASAGGVSAALTDQVRQIWPAVGEGHGRTLFLVGLSAVLIGLNVFGVKLGTRAIVALATLKLTPLVVFATVGLFFIDFSHVSFVDLPGWGALGAALVLVMFAYSGMETALIPSGEVKNPARDVPRATFAAIVLVVALYIGVQVVAQGAMGPALKDAQVPVAQAAGALWQPGLAIVLATASISMFGFLVGNLLGSSRMVYALARDGWLPSFIARVSPRAQVPRVAIVLHNLIGLALAIGGDFVTLAAVSGGAICLVYVAVAAAAWRLQAQGRADRGTPLTLPGGPALPIVAACAMLAVLATLGEAQWRAIGWSLAIIIGTWAVLRVVRGRHVPSS